MSVPPCARASGLRTMLFCTELQETCATSLCNKVPNNWFCIFFVRMCAFPLKSGPCANLVCQHGLPSRFEARKSRKVCAQDFHIFVLRLCTKLPHKVCTEGWRTQSSELSRTWLPRSSRTRCAQGASLLEFGQETSRRHFPHTSFGCLLRQCRIGLFVLRIGFI